MLNHLYSEEKVFPFLEHQFVRDWMTPVQKMVREAASLKEAIPIMIQTRMNFLPIVRNNRYLVGIVYWDSLLKAFIDGASIHAPVFEIMTTPATIYMNSYFEAALQSPHKELLVIDETGKLRGILSEDFVVGKYLKMFMEQNKKVRLTEALSTVLESAYEGIVLVDEKAVIQEINQAYLRFLDLERKDAIGKPVAQVIQNTRLPDVVRSGIPERGYVQEIQGQQVIVHRIPVWSGNQVIGAIGMVVFEGVSQLYDILARIEQLSKQKDSQVKIEYKPYEDRGKFTFDRIIGNAPETAHVKHVARRIADTPSTVLITGESGTGKEMFAKAIHYASSVAKGPFISINCAAIPEHLLEAELFGYEDGAFTGARKGGKPGKFEIAHKGTIFLDEIGDMPLPMQAKILRVLEQREVERVGGLTTYDVQVRIIAATNRNLDEMIVLGKFREDLYYRLNIIRLELPPLRQRKEDIPLLISHEMTKLCNSFGIPKKRFTPDAIHLFMTYDWPGNVRELVNTVEALVNMSEDTEIDLKDFPSYILKRFQNPSSLKMSAKSENIVSQLTTFPEIKKYTTIQEKSYIQKILHELNGNKTETARKLGIHRSTLYEKLKKYGIDD